MGGEHSLIISDPYVFMLAKEKERFRWYRFISRSVSRSVRRTKTDSCIINAGVVESLVSKLLEVLEGGSLEALGGVHLRVRGMKPHGDLVRSLRKADSSRNSMARLLKTWRRRYSDRSRALLTKQGGCVARSPRIWLGLP